MISTSRLALGCACRRRARRARSERRRSRCCAARRARAAESRAARSAPPTSLVASVGSAGHAHVASCQQHRSASVWPTLLRPIAHAGWRSSRQHHDESDGRAIESQAAGRSSWTMPTPAGHAAQLRAAAGVKVATDPGACAPGPRACAPGPGACAPRSKLRGGGALPTAEERSWIQAPGCQKRSCMAPPRAVPDTLAALKMFEHKKTPFSFGHAGTRTLKYPAQRMLWKLSAPGSPLSEAPGFWAVLPGPRGRPPGSEAQAPGTPERGRISG